MSKTALEIAKASRSIPKPPKPWNKLDPVTKSLWQSARAQWRRLHQPEYAKFGRMVVRIRTFMKMSQREFADHLQVSLSSLRRWERGYGHYPMKYRGGKEGPFEKIQRLRLICNQLKASGEGFETRKKRR